MLPGVKLFDLTGRTAIVTGGTRGLGEAMADGLASAGANVVVLSRKEEEARATADRIQTERRTKTLGLGADVTSPADVDRVVATTLERFGTIDILINNAGINIRGPIDELSYEQFKQVHDINVDGLWLMSRAVVPHMKSRSGSQEGHGAGRIVNVASTLGMVGLANRTPYASSKGAVVQMTRALALELAPWNITVNAICPGPFLTEMNIPIADSEDAKKNIIGAVALNRWGRLEEIQGAAIYLSSPAASYTTGSLLVVDGGWTAR